MRCIPPVLTLSLVAASALVAAAFAQANTETFARMPHVCGVLQTVHHGKDKTWNAEQRKFLPHMKVRLYKRTDTPCCSEVNLVEEHETSSAGTFRFRATTDGRYWVVVNWHGQDRFLPVVLTTKERDEGCNTQLFSLMPDETFELNRVVEVD